MTDIDSTNMTDSTPVFTPAEAAQRLGVSERTIWRQIRSGKLEKIEADGRTFVKLPGTSDTDKKSGRGRDNGSVNVSDSTVDLLKDTIRRQESYIDHLKENDKANQAEIRSLTVLIETKDRRYQELERRHEESLKALPAPASDTLTDTSVTIRKRVIWPWIIAGAAVLAAIGVSVYMYINY